MTLKSAWITPLDEHGRLVCLTLESAEVGEGHQLPVFERVFPTSPEDAPKRHTIQLAGLTSADCDLLRMLLDQSSDYTGYTRHKVDMQPIGAPSSPATRMSTFPILPTDLIEVDKHGSKVYRFRWVAPLELREKGFKTLKAAFNPSPSIVISDSEIWIDFDDPQFTGTLTIMW